MKYTIAIVLGLTTMTAGAFAQDQAEIDKALTAAPAQLKKDATVIKWKSDFTYDTLKQGTNSLVCYDKSGMAGVRQPFYAECTDKGNLPRQAQSLKIAAAGGDTNAALKKAESDGSRVKPVFGSVWYHAMGQDPEHVRMHMTIAVPGATGSALGLPENGKAGTIWVMDAGTSTAHLMIPGE